MAKSYVRVLDRDPDLAPGLVGADWEVAREHSVAAIMEIGRGDWRPDLSPDPAALGLLVLEGLLSRQVTIGGETSVEYIGVGDVVRPWTWVKGRLQSAAAEASWEVREPVAFAVLDRKFALRMARWPEVAATLVERATERAMSLTMQAAIRRAKVDDRLLLMLWHLAERWGQVQPEGTVVRIRLTHETLAVLIGATRPTVSTSVGDLTRRGLLARHPEGYWLLRGEMPR